MPTDPIGFATPETKRPACPRVPRNSGRRLTGPPSAGGASTGPISCGGSSPSMSSSAPAAAGACGCSPPFTRPKRPGPSSTASPCPVGHPRRPAGEREAEVRLQVERTGRHVAPRPRHDRLNPSPRAHSLFVGANLPEGLVTANAIGSRSHRCRTVRPTPPPVTTNPQGNSRQSDRRRRSMISRAARRRGANGR